MRKCLLYSPVPTSESDNITMLTLHVKNVWPLNRKFIVQRNFDLSIQRQYILENHQNFQKRFLSENFLLYGSRDNNNKMLMCNA